MCLEVFDWLGLPILQREHVYLSIHPSIFPSIHPSQFHSLYMARPLAIFIVFIPQISYRSCSKNAITTDGVLRGRNKKPGNLPRVIGGPKPTLFTAGFPITGSPLFPNHSDPGEGTHRAWKRDVQSAKQELITCSALIIASHLCSSD